jgi:hypothetical protein
MSDKYWMPGAERIPNSHSAGLPMDGAKGHYATHHITVTPKGSYAGAKTALCREGFEPTLVIDPVTNKRGQFLPANRGGFALEHNGPDTNTEGEIHIQVEWVWPTMSEDITKAPHFDECWHDFVEFARSLGIPDEWPFGFHSKSKNLAKWRTSGHRGHINAPGNSHSDNLPAAKQPAWPTKVSAARVRIKKRLRAAVHRVHHLRRKLRATK